MSEDTVVDHDHATGDVRAVLCRWCNACLGKIENWSNRIGRGVDGKEFLRNTLEYLAFHEANPSGTKYPTYKTEREKQDLRNKRARIARRKAKTSASGALAETGGMRNEPITERGPND